MFPEFDGYEDKIPALAYVHEKDKPGAVGFWVLRYWDGQARQVADRSFGQYGYERDLVLTEAAKFLGCAENQIWLVE